jgi:hypothetical protein
VGPAHRHQGGNHCRAGDAGGCAASLSRELAPSFLWNTAGADSAGVCPRDVLQGQRESSSAAARCIDPQHPLLCHMHLGP